MSPASALTGILHETVGGHASSTFYHDLAGWVMMPLALGLYWLEIAVLSRLLIEARPQHEAPRVLELMEAHRPAVRSRAAVSVTNRQLRDS